jgi:aminobenzoyl-glutamate transport protein
MSQTTLSKKNWSDRFLSVVERIGNALPHPATLFAIMCLLVMVISWLVSLTGLSVKHPGTGEQITAFNLLSRDGLHMILTKLVTNFTGFAPLGTVLVALLGIGIAEGSGLIGSLLRMLVLNSPKKMLTVVIVFCGVMSNAASEVGYVLLVPLSAVIFLSVGRHPIAGLAAAFAGVAGGYSANLLIGTIDPLLAGLSQEAARIIQPGYEVNPACNYYFMAASTFFITVIGTWVTEKVVEPRLGAYTGSEKADELQSLSANEKRGVKYAGIAIVVIIGLIVAGLLPQDGYLREAGTGSILKSPFMSGVVVIIFFAAAIAGIAYGIGAKTIKSDADVMKGMSKSMETLGSYIVLVFFAAQFVAFFNWTNLGIISAIKGAQFLQNIGADGIPLMVAFILVSALINLVMGSASAKWAIMAPVFIPMFMLLGYTPEYTQVAYRIGDSVTNVISPMMSYFALIIAFIQRYEKNAGIGTVVSTMIPYSITFLIAWTLLLIVWVLIGLPLGPGSNIYM